MKRRPLLLSFLGLLPASAGEPRPVSCVLFGSCLKQNDPAPVFRTILGHRPDLFLFLGDNIYADTDDMAEMRAKYEVLAANPDFRELLAACPVHATWDDHDYGLNDAGGDYAKRDESQRIFVDFWKDAADSPRRTRPGVYESAVYGEPGRRVQVLMLDTRYFRGTLKKGERRVGGPWYPDGDPFVPMLGEAQWAWLEEELRKPAELRLVGSSIQLVASDAGQETWSNLPAERRRFFDLVARTKANGVVVLSGDRHWAELSVEREGVPYPIWDLTSSSFNQLHARGTPTENSKRALPTTWHRENFGEVEVEWKGRDSLVHLRIRNLAGEAVLAQSLRLEDLRAK